MASAATKADVIKELPGDEEEDVLFNTIYGLRSIELNRPKKLHSLNGSMVRKIVPRLQEWQKSDMANVIVLKGSGDKALCAGGDVAVLAQQNAEGPEGQQKSTDYFALEYKLDHLIATYDKPFVAFMDGITMGGGVGLSVHAPFRIATERTLFAMPETTIGFFPDVGASFFLPKMNGATGTYLALTSERLKGVNAFYAGVATHYLHSTTLPALESRLAELRFKDYFTFDQRLDLVNSTIEEFVTGLPHDEPIKLAGPVREAIDRCFSLHNVPAIIQALKAESGDTEAWAAETLKTLQQRSPTAVHVALRQMRLGQDWSIKETFQREHQIAAKFMRHPDFIEGVTAQVIRKPAKGEPRIPPVWQPATLDDIKPEDKIADPFFEISGQKRLSLLSDVDYRTYPHARIGLPTENDVQGQVNQGGKSRAKIVNYFVEQRDGKQGVKEVVREILDRKTKVEDGSAVWIE
jgi:3-hydroxyisobutyryl-CoA hydrolase